MKMFFIITISALLFSACGQKIVTEPTEQNTESIVIVDKMQSNLQSEDMMVKEMDAEIESTIMDDMNIYMYSGDLKDVSGGGSTGVAMAGFVDNTYSLFANFIDLPEPNINYFYEGWVVRKSPFAFISTGVVKKVDGVYTNTYMSGTDYTDYDFYVLTIEPTDDGVNGNPDPAPAEHILEGVMSLISQ